MRPAALLGVLTLGACGGPAPPPTPPPTPPPPAASPAPAATGPAAPPAIAQTAIDLEPHTLTADGLAVTLAVPRGWARRDLSASARTWTYAPSPLPSRMTLAIDCAGVCPELARNLDTYGETVLVGWPGYVVTRRAQARLPSGGLELELELQQGDAPPVWLYDRFELPPDGRPPAAHCAVTLFDAAMAHRDQLRAACGAMQITRPPA